MKRIDFLGIFTISVIGLLSLSTIAMIPTDENNLKNFFMEQCEIHDISFELLPEIYIKKFTNAKLNHEELEDIAEILKLNLNERSRFFNAMREKITTSNYTSILFCLTSKFMISKYNFPCSPIYIFLAILVVYDYLNSTFSSQESRIFKSVDFPGFPCQQMTAHLLNETASTNDIALLAHRFLQNRAQASVVKISGFLFATIHPCFAFAFRSDDFVYPFNGHVSALFVFLSYFLPRIEYLNYIRASEGQMLSFQKLEKNLMNIKNLDHTAFLEGLKNIVYHNNNDTQKIIEFLNLFNLSISSLQHD